MEEREVMKKLLIAPMVLLSGWAFAGDLQSDARAIDQDAAALAQSIAAIKVNQAVLQGDLQAVATLRAERRQAMKALEQAVSSGNLSAAQADLSKVETWNASIRTAEAKVAANRHYLRADQIDRAMEGAELNQDVRDLAGDSSVHAVLASNTTMQADVAALKAAQQTLQATREQREQALQAMAVALKAGDLAGAQADLAKAQSLRDSLHREAMAVAQAHHQLNKDRKQALAQARQVAPAAVASEKSEVSEKGEGTGLGVGIGIGLGGGNSHGTGNGHGHGGGHHS